MRRGGRVAPARREACSPRPFPQVTPRQELRETDSRGRPAGLKGGRSPAPPPHCSRSEILRGDESGCRLPAAIVIAVGRGDLRAAAAAGRSASCRRAFDQAQSTTAVLAAPDLARIDLHGESRRAPMHAARARCGAGSRGLVFNRREPAAGAHRQGRIRCGSSPAQAPVSAGLLTTDPTGGGTQLLHGRRADIAPAACRRGHPRAVRRRPGAKPARDI